MDQQSLSAALTEEMNDAQTSWVVFGPFEIDHLVERLLAEVPQLAGSTVGDDGFARNHDGSYRWICLDAEYGTAAFILPRRSAFDEAMRDALFALGGGLDVTIGLYGNVNDKLWATLGGAGARQVVPAEQFLRAGN